MRRLLQFATAALLATTLAPSYAKPKSDKPQREDVEWLWQYGPDDKSKDGRENDLIQDPHFRPFLDQFLTASQTFWGVPINGKYKTLAETAYDYLSVPGSVTAEENRYLTITGHVFRFAPARGTALDRSQRQAPPGRLRRDRLDQAGPADHRSRSRVHPVALLERSTHGRRPRSRCAARSRSTDEIDRTVGREAPPRPGLRPEHHTRRPGGPRRYPTRDSHRIAWHPSCPERHGRTGATTAAAAGSAGASDISPKKLSNEK